MDEVEKFDRWRQRAILTDIADTGVAAFDTAEGFAFIDQIHAHFVSSLTGLARSWGFPVDPDEVVNLIVEKLLSTQSARYAASAEDPWGYLWTCAQRWMQDMWGRRGLPIEYAEYIPHSDGTEGHYTPLESVIDLTFGVIAPTIAGRHQAAVFELLSWLAVNPPQRQSYDLDDRIAAHRHCPSLTIDQVIAVFKIARGSRPRTAETSLMGQFLLDPDFRVSESGTHARALIHFKNEFRAGEGGSRKLGDWY